MNEIDSDESSSSESKLISNGDCTSKTNGKTKKLFYSDLTHNLKQNYEMWCEVMKHQNPNT